MQRYSNNRDNRSRTATNAGFITPCFLVNATRYRDDEDTTPPIRRRTELCLVINGRVKPRAGATRCVKLRSYASRGSQPAIFRMATYRRTAVD